MSSLETNDDQFGLLLRFLQNNAFNVVILEGPRGSGKTTCCKLLLERSDLLYYKTWGTEQKWIRGDMQDKLNLDLPQGTYFVLDFIKQARAALSRPILADRGNISAIAYQRELPYGQNAELRKYYVNLMRDSGAIFLYLTAPVDTIVARRVGRGDQDEQFLYKRTAAYARRIVEHDVNLYASSVDMMLDAGLDEVAQFELGGGTTCTCLVPEGVSVVEPEEIKDVSQLQ